MDVLTNLYRSNISLSVSSGVKSLFLYDPDVVEDSNRNRLPFCESSIGRNKVDVVADFIKAIRPDTTVIAIPQKLEGILLQIQLSSGTVFIECTDSPKSQFSIYNTCVENGVRFIRAGYDGTSITVSSSVPGWIKTDVEAEPYTFNPSWAVPAITVAALAVGKMMKYKDQEVSLDISEIGITVLQPARRRLTPRCVPSRRRQ